MDEQYPGKENTSDYLFGLVKGGIGSIPIVGNIGAEVFGLIAKEPLEKRREKWFNTLLEKVRELESKKGNVDLEKLKENEDFISMLLEASSMAMRTTNEEKLDYLRKAILNTLKQNHNSEEEKFNFLFLIDFLRAAHIKLLKKIFDQGSTYSGHADLYDVFTRFNVLNLKEQEFYTIFNDLESRGLIQRDPTHTNSIAFTRFIVRPTDIGRRFVHFIS